MDYTLKDLLDIPKLQQLLSFLDEGHAIPVLTEKVLLIRADIPVLICTGHSAVLNPARAQQLGIRSVLMKPINYRELCRQVRELFAESDSRKEL